MRPRFSLRTLLILTTALALFCYYLLVRPITLAKAFADRVAAKEYHPADLLCSDSKKSFLVAQAADWDNCDVEVKLERREWSDIIRCQQRMTLEARRRVPITGTNDYIALCGSFLAGPLFIKTPAGLYPETFHR